MKLLRVHIISAQTCGGLLDGVHKTFRYNEDDNDGFDPLCFVGPNGSGKSQFLQILAEIFQTISHAVVPTEERSDANSGLLFEIEYQIGQDNNATIVKVSRKKPATRSNHQIKIETLEEGEWKDVENVGAAQLLPGKIVGYTSGDNETLSLPFLNSRAGYAKDVREAALDISDGEKNIPDTRLINIDYATHLEVMLANLLTGSVNTADYLLKETQLDRLHSFRCIIQLAHPAAPGKGVKLTQELERVIEKLKACSTCYDHDDKKNTYILDYFVDAETEKGFKALWENPFDLYSDLHKLAMLNDLIIKAAARNRFDKEIKSRQFASKLPEPYHDDKVFRFEHVRFHHKTELKVVDYVSLSDGEHQLVQILGVLSMLDQPNVLFLLDEPESHFNPQWRAKFTSQIVKNRPSANNQPISQECILTTHSPFVPSDRPKERVFIFKKTNDEDDGVSAKIEISEPKIQTYGATFNSILQHCFGVNPPISKLSNDEIDTLRESEDIEAIKEGMKRLGQSVQKALLADRLFELEEQINKEGD
ncbi:restriction system-associated AAA family ATPase [Kiloniella sp. b19]|uniref:restriction system-associated AAA family ATPase n=1 Tax=Kiloniella sp. GXU_MW_B19 TaxID=3141326 RepID=UPI0031DED023